MTSNAVFSKDRCELRVGNVENLVRMSNIQQALSVDPIGIFRSEARLTAARWENNECRALIEFMGRLQLGECGVLEEVKQPMGRRVSAAAAARVNLISISGAQEAVCDEETTKIDGIEEGTDLIGN